jgi:hypothetical protein
MGREPDDTPPELAAWVRRKRGQTTPARTAELAAVLTDRGTAWVCRLWAGGRCVAVGRAGVREAGGRGLAVARACELAEFVMPVPEPAEEVSAASPGRTKARRR